MRMPREANGGGGGTGSRCDGLNPRGWSLPDTNWGVFRSRLDGLHVRLMSVLLSVQFLSLPARDGVFRAEGELIVNPRGWSLPETNFRRFKSSLYYEILDGLKSVLVTCWCSLC